MSSFNPIKSAIGYLIQTILSEYLQDGHAFNITNDQISKQQFSLKDLKLDCNVSLILKKLLKLKG